MRSQLGFDNLCCNLITSGRIQRCFIIFNAFNLLFAPCLRNKGAIEELVQLHIVLQLSFVGPISTLSMLTIVIGLHFIDIKRI
ncbi:hypothetical protein DsansV1_C10g0099711 [Dioscorea sansibarensis]